MNDYYFAGVVRPAVSGSDLRLRNDWSLARGQVVEVRHDNIPTRTGMVEDVTADGYILWLAADGPATRTMVDRSEGYEIWGD
ncbi:hypothetical protein [Arthrobacter sp. B2a2-09]|uniref:hypothetical protein n=1 Tax=Arthrobacter sp. B2a2-09 TaxID=2952822 RepID=UPI0022CD2A89|nr:hypothetical protein [Arthrobacter sp. B2a2-09]MCZ9884963.1 hypothetical protein [Arthrobacter sp. B2a2-09]